MGSNSRFGERIHQLRVERDWSRYEAARAIQISQHRLAELEEGRSRGTGRATLPTRETVARIARAYEVPRDSLLELAGFSIERPAVSDDDALLLDLFRALSDERRRLVLAAVKAIAREP